MLLLGAHSVEGLTVVEHGTSSLCTVNNMDAQGASNAIHNIYHTDLLENVDVTKSNKRRRVYRRESC